MTPETREELAQALMHVAHEAAVKYLRREREGASASMNGALEYVDYAMISAIAPIIDRLVAAAVAGETERLLLANASIEALIAERDAAVAAAGLADRAFKRFINEQPDLMAALQAGISEGRASATDAIVAWLRTDATRCDCAAHSEGECACGAWSDYKRVYETDIADAIERGDHLKNPIDR